MAVCDYNHCGSAFYGMNMSCVAQAPPSEVVIQPSAVAVTIPGATLSTSSEPVAVAQYSPWANGYGSYPYGGVGGYGGGYGYGCGRRYSYGSLYPYCYPGYSRRCGPC